VIMAVRINLAREGSPRLQADVHQAEVLIPKIVIKHTLRNLLGDEARPTFTTRQLERGASFHHTQNTNETVTKRMLVQLLFGPGILVDVALIILVKPTAFVGERFAMFDKPLGPGRRGDLHEVGATHLQDVIDERLELRRVAERQMSFEDHPIKTRKLPENQADKLRDERAYCLHGIRFLNDCW